MIASTFLDMVAPILGFGFLGLSLLMLYLGYALLKQMMRSEVNRNPDDIKMVKFFMLISLIFMLCSGPLQWITMLVQEKVDKSKKQVDFKVSLTPLDDSLELLDILNRNKDGELSFRAGANNYRISHEFEMTKAVIKHGDALIFDIYPIIKHMEKKVDQLNAHTRNELIKERVKQIANPNKVIGGPDEL